MANSIAAVIISNALDETRGIHHSAAVHWENSDFPTRIRFYEDKPVRQLMMILKTLFMAACAIVIFGPITQQLRKLDQFIPVNFPSWIARAGVVFMAAGTVTTFGCFVLFAGSGALTPGAAFPDPAVFISRGPYRYVRNPMAEGAFAFLAGWGFYQLSPAILIFGVVMAMLMHLFVVYVEEPKLERRFGQSYRTYKIGVNRWLPGRVLTR
jgi:protein-S-isoprenylcysteine O-methyltransferase Ste14